MAEWFKSLSKQQREREGGGGRERKITNLIWRNSEETKTPRKRIAVSE